MNPFQKYEINPRQFLMLWVAAMVGYFAALPFGLSIQREALAEAGVNIPSLIVTQFSIIVVVYGLFIFLGLRMIKATPFHIGRFGQAKDVSRWRLLIELLVVGFAVFSAIGIFELVFNLVFGELVVAQVITQPAAWKGLLASLYGGINEEILLRLFVMTGITFSLQKFSWTARHVGTATTVWWSILIAALLFAVGHVPVLFSAQLEVDTELVARVLAPNFAAGIAFGYLYWKRGLIAAMISHATLDILLHCVLPMLKG